MQAPVCKQNFPRLLVACAALLILCFHDAAAQGRGPAPCRDGQLSARKADEDAAMGGARITDYALTNTSRAPCTLRGFPGFELLNASGRVVRRGRAAAEQHPEVVSIEPGKAATFSVSYNAGGAGRVGKPCPTYPRVRITAPGQRRGLVLREPLQVCGEVEVLPVGPPSGEQPPG
ncbi:MAG: DUF4232 domain-containing protein [Acidobacteria bacterium]|nr:DUF4232 domain-containing protein [Acidobacteriota bacterium]